MKGLDSTYEGLKLATEQRYRLRLGMFAQYL